ncbi:hypothetical protein ACFVJH_32230 [Streptomyces decoyicus]|uniref:2Fe-2S iron-sulfur cluster-binding protein n=1 Tax=Streptomyces decoyicus TaxID=249567 RepID=UPI003628B06B
MGVPAERSILDALTDAGLPVAGSCREGVCGISAAPSTPRSPRKWGKRWPRTSAAGWGPWTRSSNTITGTDCSDVHEAARRDHASAL